MLGFEKISVSNHAVDRYYEHFSQQLSKFEIESIIQSSGKLLHKKQLRQIKKHKTRGTVYLFIAHKEISFMAIGLRVGNCGNTLVVKTIIPLDKVRKEILN